MGITQLNVKCDSLLVVQQVTGNFQEDDWRSPFITYLQTGNISNNIQNPQKFKRRASFYTIIVTELYKRGFTRPLLRCLNTTEAKLAIDEVHEGVYGTHIGGRSLAAKILRAGYYWPTLQQDYMNKVKHCNHCQRHAPIIHNPTEQLHRFEICWPFNK
ncbi:uncharacterized protein [Arachis hypogaea]|uniref:uncharacterized protein n=1 Tax=Arachis hypogaea TaxID=3818 RepID=UPI0007AF48A2